MEQVTATDATHPEGLPATTVSVEVRPPLRSELRACRLILPEVFRRGVLPDLLLAVCPAPLRYLGVLAYALVTFEGEPAWRLRLHVVRGHRRGGVGTRLVRSLRARGEGRGVRALIAPREEDESGADDFLRALGFRQTFRSTVYEGDLEHYRSVVRPLCARLQSRGKVPPEARAVPPQDAPPQGLSQLLTEHSRRTPHSLGEPWQEAWLRPSVRQASTALLLGGQVIGAILAEQHGDRAEVIWRVVAPPYRGGWANVLLSAATWERMFQSGVRRVRFSTTTHTPDTERFVRLHGAEKSYATDYYVLLRKAQAGTS